MKCMSREATHNVVHLNDWNELDLTKPRGMRKAPVNALKPDLLRWMRNTSKLEEIKSFNSSIQFKKLDTCFLFFSSHYQWITTAPRITSLIASVKHTETGNTRTIEPISSLWTGGRFSVREVSRQNNPIHPAHHDPDSVSPATLTLQPSAAALITGPAGEISALQNPNFVCRTFKFLLPFRR